MFLWHPASAGNRFLRRFCVCSQKFKNDEERMPSVYFFAQFVISWCDLYHYICFIADFVTVCFFLLSHGYCFITYTEFSLISAPLSYDKGKTHRCDKRKYSVAVFIVLILNHMSLGKKETLVCFRLVLRKFTSIVISKRFGGCMERNNLRQDIFLSGVRGGDYDGDKDLFSGRQLGVVLFLQFLSFSIKKHRFVHFSFKTVQPSFLLHNNYFQLKSRVRRNRFVMSGRLNEYRKSLVSNVVSQGPVDNLGYCMTPVLLIRLVRYSVAHTRATM